MKLDELKSILLREAEEAGICREGRQRFSACATLGDLLDFYTENPEWCIERNFPTPATLMWMWAHMGEEMEHHGVYCRRRFEGEALTGRQAYVLLGCSGTVRTGLNAEKGLIPMFYFADGCDMEIEGCGRDKGLRLPSKVALYVAVDCAVRAVDGGGVKFLRFPVDFLTPSEP